MSNQNSQTDAEKAAAETAAKEQAEREAAEKAEAEKAAKAGKGGKADSDAKADEIPAYQRADYNGPLTIPQAQWRLRNIKPVTGARTK